MELRQLRHLVALAETGGFTAAAAREHIVQSGLSNSVRNLERECGTDLYIRAERPVRLTPAGAALVAQARLVLAAARAASDAVRDIVDVASGTLRVGVIGSALHLVPLTDYLVTFADQHPGVDVHLLQAPVWQMLDHVARGELDCAVVAQRPDPPAGVRLTTIAREDLLLLFRDDDPMATHGSPSVDDLAGRRFVDVGPHWSARSAVDAALTAHGVTRHIRCEVNEWALFVDLVAGGLGIGFAPAGVARAAVGRDPRLRVAAVDGLDLRRRIQLALPQVSGMTPAARRFADLIERSQPVEGPD